MPEFDLLYATMYESVSQAITEMDKMNFGEAKKILVHAQQCGKNACFSSEEYRDMKNSYLSLGVIIAEKRRRRRIAEREKSAET